MDSDNNYNVDAINSPLTLRDIIDKFRRAWLWILVSAIIFFLGSARSTNCCTVKTFPIKRLVMTIKSAPSPETL